MEVHPPEPLLVHPLPPAPCFVGREAELQELRGLWQGGFRGVVALVGLGGAGKTAIAARFLEGVVGPGGLTRPEGLFVWSFYQEPDAGLFLQQAHRYFARTPAPAPAKGAGLLHLLRDALATGGPHLLVLDGLERVQRQETGTYGQVEDPLLKGLLGRVVEGSLNTVALVTSRFPLTDLDLFRGTGYRHVDVGGLSVPAGQSLLRHRGVQADDTALAELVAAYGAHALTLEHLGGLIGQFLGGDPRRAPEVPSLSAPGSDRQALRLARLLRAYEDHLPPPELTLLCRLCLLRRSVGAKQIMELFLCSPAVHMRTARGLGNVVPRLEGLAECYASVRQALAASVRATVEEALCSAPIAGPEEAFQQEILTAADTVWQILDQWSEPDLDGLGRLYADASPGFPTDQRPLSADDRDALRALYARYVELRDHPLRPFREPAHALTEAFKNLGWKKPGRKTTDDLRPDDVLRAFGHVRGRLQLLALKHLTLRRVRELCRFYQRKWQLAGPVAHLDAAEVHNLLDTLAGRHLILREADGSFSVHPAVRDHFYRLATAPDQRSWHDIIREQMVSLVRRPGVRLPQDRATLDMAEEAVYHALQAGRTDDALWLYNHVLGGLRHLGWKLGEMARGLRILRGFSPCPDRWELGWYLRALGELEEAYEENPLPFFRADIRLLQGRLPLVAAEGDEARTAVAAFLMGKSKTLPPQPLSCVVPRDQVLLYLGRHSQVGQSALFERFYHDIGWEGERARCRLLLAEVARRQGDRGACRAHLEAASAWVLHSGSAEHLCLLHLMSARAARTAGDLDVARRVVSEGLHTARQCGLGLYHIELLSEQAEVCLSGADAAAAESAAREALRRAVAAECRFRWGASEAGQLLGQALAAQKDYRRARRILTKTLRMRQAIGDPRAEDTRQLLASLPR